MRLLLDLLAFVRAFAADRARLALENVVLRRQINAMKRSVKRARASTTATVSSGS